MANEIISADIYDINAYVNNIMKKHIDIDEDTQYMGIFGYLNEMHSLLLQNQIIMSAELANEAIPILAKYDKNIITHAASMGVADITATPAYFNVLAFFVEDQIIENMRNGVFVHDKNVPIYADTFEFHTEYDLVIAQSTLANGETVYTARYDMTINNPISDVTNPYLNPPMKINMGGTSYLMLDLNIRQMEFIPIYDKVMTSNAIESKTYNFEFEGQLADFNVEVVEGDKTYHLIPYYDGTIVKDESQPYCYYSYLNENHIRIKFVEDSYYPAINSDITVNVITTQGKSGNFKWKDDIVVESESLKYNYSNVSILFRPIDGESFYGADKKTMDDLKKIIPKEALSRGSITSAADLNNHFNMITDNTNCAMYFFKKRDNQLERLYYAYIILKDEYGVIPTNTAPLNIYIKDFISSTDVKYVINPGTPIYLSPGSDVAKILASPDEISNLPEGSFVYTSPFMIVVNSKPLSVSYYLTVLNKRYYVKYAYINQDSTLQFITNYVTWRRPFTYNRNKYTMSIDVTQNIAEDQDILIKDEQGNVVDSNLRVIAVISNEENAPYRWMEGKMVNYDPSTYTYSYEFTCTTEDTIDEDNKIKIDGMNDLGEDNGTYGYFNPNCQCQIYVLVRQDQEKGRSTLDSIVPGLEGWTLSNRYDINSGIDFYMNYSHIVTSAISAVLEDQETLLADLGEDTFLVKRKVTPNSVIRIVDIKTENTNEAYFGYEHVNFNSERDIMEVYLDGIKLVHNVDFTINEGRGIIQAIYPEGWVLDEGMEDMRFEFLVLKNAIAVVDGSVRYKFEMTRGGKYVKESTSTVNFICGTITDFDFGSDTLEVYMNGLKLSEGTDFEVDLNEPVIRKIGGEWICDEREPKNYFEFIRIKNNKYEETEESTAIVIGAVGDSCFKIASVPLVKYEYIVDSETNTSAFIDQLETRKEYIDIEVENLENNFGVDFKFVNTYGPSKAFYVANGQLIDRVNLTMNFRMQVVTNSDKYIKDYIIDYIKEYVENIESIDDIHIPNLITAITTKYREQLVYFEFLGFNEYGPGYQHIYQNEDIVYGTVVPEFLNIYTENGVPSINIAIV